MAPDPQLLTKQVIGNDLDNAGSILNVRFNLQRGKIARVWGFNCSIVDVGAFGATTFSAFVRKTAGAERQTTPQDLLWSVIYDQREGGTSFWGMNPTQNIMFPKPHRTSGLTIQMHADTSTSARIVIIVYYDIDDVTKGELVQKWEKNISKGRTRRTISP